MSVGHTYTCRCETDIFLSAVIVYFKFVIVYRKSATTNQTMSELNKFRKHSSVRVSPLNVIA